MHPRVLIFAFASLELADDFFDKCLESREVVDRELGEHLSIDFDSFLCQTTDEVVVLCIALLAGSSDTNNPLSAKIALLGSAVTKSVLTALHHLFVGSLE